MTAPRPLLETREASPEVLELLRDAPRSRSLDRSARERSEWRVARLAAIPAAAGALVWLQHLALGAVLGAAVAGAVLGPRALASKASGHMTRDPGVASRARPSLGPPSAAVASASAEPPAEASPAGAPPVQALPTAPAKSPSASRQKPEDELAREAKMLEQARALVAIDPRGALATLLRHEREFSHGALELERDLLTIEALVRLGRRPEAEARARAFRAHAPGSLYEGRLDRLLGEGI